MDAALVIGGKYHVIRAVAEGGMGAVYDAVHGKTGRRVALKLIHERGLTPGSPALHRFEREAKLASAVDSRHVVQVLDAGEDDASGMPFLVMEYLEGEDLRSVLQRGPLPPARALSIVADVCSGLVHAHEAGIVHRDLKPSNLFLAESGGDTVVKILDFGIAKLLDEGETNGETRDLTRTGDVVGSPPYMSPEQITSPRDVDHRSDLWSLGVVLYELLSGETPTAGVAGIGARVYAICHLPAPPLSARVPGLSPDICAVVHRALAVAPGARFASASEMLEALRALLDQAPHAAPAPSAAHAAPAPPTDVRLPASMPPVALEVGSGVGAHAVARERETVTEIDTESGTARRGARTRWAALAAVAAVGVAIASITIRHERARAPATDATSAVEQRPASASSPVVDEAARAAATAVPPSPSSAAALVAVVAAEAPSAAARSVNSANKSLHRSVRTPAGGARKAPVVSLDATGREQL